MCLCFSSRCGCFGLAAAADHDLPQALAEAWFGQLQINSFCDCVTLEFWELFRGLIVVDLGRLVVIAVVKEKNKRKEISLGIFLIPLSPLSCVSYPVLGGKTGSRGR